MHLPRNQCQPGIAMSIILFTAFSVVSTQASSDKGLPPAPPTGTPTGNPTPPGGTRPEARGGCPTMQPPLTALVRAGQDFTLSEHPTLWVYVPYSKTEVQTIEFTLHNAQLTKTFYRTSIPAPERAGIIAIPIPSNISLIVGQNYQWKLILECQSKPVDIPNLILNGWIQRLELTPNLSQQIQAAATRERTELYLNNGGWYDALTNLAKLRLENPQDFRLQKQWRDLLKSADWDSLSEQPLVKP